MPVYKAPTRDTLFVLNELLQLGDYSHLPGFEMATSDMIEAVIEEGGKFCNEVLAPLNHSGDAEGCTRHPDGSVTTPAAFKEAFAKFREAGWNTLCAPTAFGGQGMPYVIGVAMGEYTDGANQAFAMYPGLTNGAVAAIGAAGSPEQQALFLPKMISGEWTGTMNLTEPHCGTDLGMIRTRAVPNADGSYAVSGTKIFISAGEHDMSDNIVHLVLAKTPDAPDSTKGISMFIVPKYLVNVDGSLGARNGVSCGAIEHKMGINGNATCVLNYDGATGYMIGAENNGLAGMFVMMNAARLGVGVQGLSQAEAAYQNGIAYALERRQGRAPTGAAEPAEKADPIFVHPDIRRMLMDARAFVEGMRALSLWTGLQVDLAHHLPDEAERQRADDLLGLITPVLKGYGTDKGYEVATNMQQIWGGHGYIRDNGMDQFVRDVRISMIYEGANGVQAMDLVGRKLASKGGRAVQAFFAMVDGDCAAAKADASIAAIAEKVEKANGELKAATMWLMQNAMANPENAGAAAYPYMHLMGIVALGDMWVRTASHCAKALADGSAEKGLGRAFHEAKLVTARYFADRFLPDAGALRRKIEAGAESMMMLGAEAFAA